MKKAFWLIPALIVSAAVLALLGQTFTSVGADKCQICHRTESQGRQYPIWKASRHAASFASLSSAKEDAAKHLGISDPTEEPKCLKCHAPLFVESPDLKAEGVTCEACHGPGSEYKKLSLMRNPEEARKNGLASFADAAAVKAKCLTCHDKAHDRPFDFASAWGKIKHDVPGQE